MIIEGNTITDSQDISENFNNFFTLIYQDLQKNIAPNKKRFSHYPKAPNIDIFYILPTTPKEISDLIEALKNSKSSNPNSMPTNILQDINETIFIPLSTLISKSFMTSVFPNLCKIAIVVPVFESVKRLLCNNYSPMSLLSSTGKTIKIKTQSFLRNMQLLLFVLIWF